MVGLTRAAEAGSFATRKSLKFSDELLRTPGMTSTLGFPAASTPSERWVATLAHAGTVFAWFLAPLIIYLLARRRSGHVAAHALQALIWSGIGTLVAFLTCGLAIPVFMVFHLIAAWKTWQGDSPGYPALTDFIKGWR